MNSKNLYYILFLLLIKLSFSIVPLWNYTSSTIKLLNRSNNYKYSYDVVNRELHGVSIKMTRTIYRDSNNSTIQENRLFLDGRDYGTTDYDDIESAYRNNTDSDKLYNYYVCPKGRYHVHLYEKNSTTHSLLKKEGFNYEEYENKGNWSLHCFFQYNERHLFIFYLHSEFHIFEYDFYQFKFTKSQNVFDGLYAYKWKTRPVNGEKEMIAITKKDEEYVLQDILITVKQNEAFNLNANRNYQNLVRGKSKFFSFFLNNTDYYNFVFINYENDTDFESGYFMEPKTITNDNISSINIVKNEVSPFEFLGNITIKSTTFIYGTKYVYYKIYDNDANKNYYGILDVTLNKIIYNTDHYIVDFRPFSNYAMQAITTHTAYLICTIREGDNCIETCPDDKILVLDSTGANHCISKSESDNKCSNSKFILMPNEICVNECDENIFTIINGNECWLCKDINKYKLINYTGCFEERVNLIIHIMLIKK